MPTQWQDRYTDLSNVNSGNELQNGDDILAQHVNVALENGAYAKKIADQNTNSINTINNDIDNIEGDISGIEGDIDSIEQRLTNLGFRYPSSSQTIALLDGGTSVASVSILANGSGNVEGTSRQGNRVILSMSITLYSGGSGTAGGILFRGSTVTSTTSLPTEYRPKSQQTFYVPSGRATYIQTVGTTNYTHYIYVPVKVMIKTDGTFSMRIDDLPSSMSTTLTFNNCQFRLVDVKVGYQANPIS